jgi:hypothetical protein
MTTRRLLLVGEDPALLKTRALLLSNWSSTIVSSREAREILARENFALIVFGQLVPLSKTIELIKIAEGLTAPPKVLAIRFPGDADGLGVETHILDTSDKPGWLIDKVAKIICGVQDEN